RLVPAASFAIASCDSNACAIAHARGRARGPGSPVEKMPARTLRDLPLPGGEVEVVPPGGDLPLADLEAAGHRPGPLPAVHREAIDPFGEHEAAPAGDVHDLELGRLGRRREHVAQLANAVVPRRGF